MRDLLFLMSVVAVFGCTPREGPIDPGPPPPADPFTILVMPDIQYLTLNADTGVFDEMITWALDHKDDLNIAMVLQEGDLTHNNSEAEWQAADAGFSRLDNVLPYVVCVGNHDMDGNDANTRDTTRYNQWFGLDRLSQQQTFYASASDQSADDHAHVFSAGGRDWMVVSLAYDPTDEALDWAVDLVADHPEHRVIVLTHAYLAPNATVASEGIGIRDRIVDPHPNVRMVLNGHFIGGINANRRRKRDDGSQILEVFANYQDLTQAGGGRMRLMQVDVDAGTLDVSTCNAYDQCSDDEGDTFGWKYLRF